MALYATLITTFGILAIVAFLGALGLGAGLALAGPRESIRSTLDGQTRHPIAWAWGVSLLAMLGSLYFSEVAGLVPCSFCWYQRIAMYPLVFVLGVGAVRRDTGVWRYGLPLSIIGALIATYHVIIQWQPALEVGTCTSGAPCTGRYVAAFGFISIPTMAGAAFLLITALLFLVRALENRPSTQPSTSQTS